jgi:hypothetical protein
MDRLRWIATGGNESDFGRFLQRAKTLRIPGAEWNLVFERQLFGEMLKQGFQSFRSPSFSEF